MCNFIYPLLIKMLYIKYIYVVLLLLIVQLLMFLVRCIYFPTVMKCLVPLSLQRVLGVKSSVFLLFYKQYISVPNATMLSSSYSCIYQLVFYFVNTIISGSQYLLYQLYQIYWQDKHKGEVTVYLYINVDLPIQTTYPILVL